MKDLGFGLVEQRSVIVVLMTATLCHLLGLNFPLHTDNIMRAFVDLVFLTGYLYIGRSIVRFPIVFCIGIWNAIKKNYEILERYQNDSRTAFYVKIKNQWVDLRRVYVFLASLVDQNKWKGFLGFIDRAILIVITVLVTLPKSGQNLMIIGGGIGIASMLLIYLIGGSFSFIVEDALKRNADQRAEEQREFVRAASTHPEFPKAIETYTVDRRYDNING